MPLWYLGLGSNLGDRLENLRAAIAALASRGLEVQDISSVYETSPVDVPDEQRAYLNVVVAVTGPVDPTALVAACLSIEQSLGRTREVRHAARTIDIDVLLGRGVVSDSPAATVPHPALHERLFVLAPMRELAGSVVHPRLGVTVEELYQRVARCASECVRLYAPPAMVAPGDTVTDQETEIDG
jgi:2-amino-4-hydroxy-6-hydroxymethyldihydropteridine diphosphokinase